MSNTEKIEANVINECPTCGKLIEELPKTIWHYTKMDILEKIFPQKNSKEYKINEKKIPQINLRFTNCRFKNDPSESLILHDLLVKNEDHIVELYKCNKEDFDKYIKKAKEHSKNSYIFSMSYLEDSFAFWSKEYAGADGIAIVFNKDNFENLVQGSEFGNFFDVVYNESIKSIYEYSRILYEQRKCYFDSLSKEHSSPPMFYALNCFLDCYSSIYKLASWKHELEIRAILAYFNMEEKEKINAKIEFMENKITKSCYEYFDKNIVNSIMLGPACGEEHIEVVEDYLKENGYEGIKVDRSKALDLRYRGKI